MASGHDVSESYHTHTHTQEIHRILRV